MSVIIETITTITRPAVRNRTSNREKIFIFFPAYNPYTSALAYHCAKKNTDNMINDIYQ